MHHRLPPRILCIGGHPPTHAFFLASRGPIPLPSLPPSLSRRGRCQVVHRRSPQQCGQKLPELLPLAPPHSIHDARRRVEGGEGVWVRKRAEEMVEVGGDRATSVSRRRGRRGGSNTAACRKSALGSSACLAAEYPSPSILLLLPLLSSRGGGKTVKVKLISEICRNGAFLKDRAMFSYAGGERGGGGGGGGMFDRCGHLDREINFLTLQD